jgi:pentatricopeptide repeat protein
MLGKQVSGRSLDGYPVALLSAAAAYIVGTLVSNALSVALLALLIACAALIMSAALICWHQQQNNGKLSEPHAFNSASLAEPMRDHSSMNAAAVPFRPAPFNPTMHVPPAPSPDRIRSDVNAQNSQIIYHSQEGNMEQAVKAVHAMRAQGNKPKLIAYSCFLDACAKSGQVKRAEQCLRYMQEDHMDLNTVCYCTLINVYASAGDVDKAEQYFQNMLNAGGDIAPNTSAYNALIKACSRVRHIERAEGWFAHMKAASVEPNVITFTTLINACAKTRDAERADKWLSVMSDHHVEANLMTYNSVIDACAKVGDTQRAEKTFGRLRKENIPPDIVTYNSLINTFGQSGDVDGAARWLETMIKDGLEPDNVSFSTCIGACVKKGDMSAAKAWLTKMFDFGVELSAVNYSTLIHAGIKAGDFDFSECLLAHNITKNIHTEPITYRAFIHAVAKANQSERAMNWLEHMVHAHGLTLITTDDMFGPVISAFCNCQNTKAIMDWVMKMKHWNIPVTQPIYSKTIKALQRSGQNKLARELAEEMNKVMPHTRYPAHHGGRVGSHERMGNNYS